VSLDTNKNRIVVYSQVIQLFEIIEYQTTEEMTRIFILLLVKTTTEMISSIITRKIRIMKAIISITTIESSFIIYSIYKNKVADRDFLFKVFFSSEKWEWQVCSQPNRSFMESLALIYIFDEVIVLRVEKL
jgi:hypothetical protein